MSEQSSTLRLWSDFDGTAVKKFGNLDFRNWTKYPLPLIAGYKRFLSGVQEQGVEIAGVVTTRKDIPLRRGATHRSIAKHSLDQFFPHRHQVVLSGSYQAKADFLVAESREATIGMLDDKPLDLGPSILQSLIDNDRPGTVNHKKILLGVVHSERSEREIDQLIRAAERSTAKIEVGESFAFAGDYEITGGNFKFGIVPLQPYSIEAGQQFAAKIEDLNAR